MTMKFPSDPFHPFLMHNEWIERHLAKDEPLNDIPSITEFYANQEIFITGFSGFIGKVLVEKLLRSCPDIKNIYVLLRPKKGKSIGERLKVITETIVFDILRRQNPNFNEKLIAIEGDVMELNLGISDADCERMKNVSIIFHSAASVRFDDTLKYAVLNNTRGTREIMKFAEKLNKIRVIMHVSTTYSNVYLDTIEEKIYPMIADWQKTIEICEKYDQNKVDILTQHYINFMPNTYVFSKNLAENVTNDYRNKLPVVLFRPSIVISAFEEPYAGYVDNHNGPMGILIASSTGISKTMYCDQKNVMALCPVDVCVKAMIICAWKRAHEKTTESLSIVNAASANKTKIMIKQLLDIGIYGICREIPMGKKMVALPSGSVTLHKSWNIIRVFFYQLILAVIADVYLRSKGKSPRLMKIQRKMFEANKALSYFVTHNWDFKNENFLKLCTYLQPQDLRAFDFRSFFTADMIHFVRTTLYGFRRYLLKLKDEDLEKDREMFKKLENILFVVKILIYTFILYLLIVKYKIVDYLNYLKNA